MHGVVYQLEQWLDRSGVSCEAVVVAISGGPDSVALFQAWAAVRTRRQAAGPFVLAHYNHQLRGEESEADEAFVRQLADSSQRLPGLRLVCGRGDVAGQQGNREAAARRLRYAWLAGLARETGIPFVATGHTADDQAETVLHRLLRGTGLKGLTGIAARRRLTDGVELIRPLLAVSRKQLLDYLQSLGQTYRTDSSNRNLELTRNRIRHELLPHLTKHYNPAVARVLTHLAEQAAEACRFLEGQAAVLLHQAELPRAGERLIFDRNQLHAAPRILVRELFRLAWAREGWPQRGMRFSDWDRLAAVAYGEARAADLPGSIHARCRGSVVQLGPRRYNPVQPGSV